METKRIDAASKVAHRAQEALEIAQVDFDEGVKKAVCARGIFAEHGKEVVHPVVKLAHFKQVAAEEAKNGAISSGT